MSVQNPPLLDRRVTVTSAANMRDLGGIPVSGGVFTPGQVYRSAVLPDLNQVDSQALSDLGVALVYDLRTEEERGSQPDRLPASAQLKILDVLADASSSVAATIGRIRTAPDSMMEILSSGGIQLMLLRAADTIR